MIVPAIFAITSTLILPVCVILYWARQKTPKITQKIIFYFLVYTIINHVITSIHIRYPLSFFHWSRSLYTPIELTFISIYFYYSLTNEKLKYICTVCMVAFWIYYFGFSEEAGKDIFDSVQVSIESIIVITYCLLYYYQEIRLPAVDFVYSKPDFMITSAFLLYMTGNFYIYMYRKQFDDDIRFGYTYEIIHGIFYGVRNVLFCIALTMPARKETKNNTIMNPIA